MRQFFAAAENKLNPLTHTEKEFLTPAEAFGSLEIWDKT